MKLHVSFIVAASILASASTTFAQSSNAAIAETAFQRGKELMAEGKPAEACPKFEESHRLDPSVGALLNLGRCYEKLGRTASAWVRFKEAATLARTLGQTERETIARDLTAGIEPKLSRVRIEATTRVPGMRITRNGEDVGLALLGDPLPVDPGDLTVEVVAPGYAPWSKTIQIGKEADLKSIVIPALEPDAKPRAATESSSGLRTAAFVVGGVGIVSIGVGAVFGGFAVQDKGEADPLCPNKSCDAQGFAHIEDAKKNAFVSNISLGVGAAAFGAGVVLFLVSRPGAPKDSAQRSWLVPMLGPRGGGATAILSF